MTACTCELETLEVFFFLYHLLILRAFSVLFWSFFCFWLDVCGFEQFLAAGTGATASTSEEISFLLNIVIGQSSMTFSLPSHFVEFTWRTRTSASACTSRKHVPTQVQHFRQKRVCPPSSGIFSRWFEYFAYSKPKRTIPSDRRDQIFFMPAQQIHQNHVVINNI